MNASFIKMLRFEYKSNFTLWAYLLILAFSVLAIFFYAMSNSSFIFGIRSLYFILFFLITWLFTLYSYQESTSSQSMQMYHLISVSRNVKFFSKQFITLLVFPIMIIAGTVILVSVINIFNLGKENVELMPHDEKILLWILVWILGNSISTLLAIVFKKNKILYAMLTYFVGKIVLGIVVLILIYALKSNGSIDSFQFSSDLTSWEPIGYTGIFILSAIFYGVSYYLFFRRQL
ncbi:MAG: hypothetical protein ACM3RX_05455 [Methanococcaceae archaeon]